jgi:lysophospholipase
VAIYQRSKEGTSTKNSEFPKVPDQNTFINLGLNNHPTFFGCDTGSHNSSGPLIVYLPNVLYIYLSNFITFDLEYNDSERNQIVRNGYNVATMGNGTEDSDWPACVGCAVLACNLIRLGTDIPSKCVECFARYCWNGTINSIMPGTYEPEQIVSSGVGDLAPCLRAMEAPVLIALMLLYL